MRYRLILIFLLLLLISIISSAQIRVGALAGLNSTSFSGDTPQGANFASNVGYSGGITADLFFLDDVSVLLQPMYSHKTSTIQFDVNYQYDPIDSMDLFIDYVEIPLNVKVTANNKIAYVTAGLTFSIPLSATIINNTLGSETDIKEFFESFSVSANFGVGVQFKIGKPYLFFELRYSQGLTNLSKSTNEEYRIIQKLKSNSMQLYTGILFTL